MSSDLLSLQWTRETVLEAPLPKHLTFGEIWGEAIGRGVLGYIIPNYYSANILSVNRFVDFLYENREIITQMFMVE